MLTVPRQAACSWEQLIVTGGSTTAGYDLVILLAIAQATIVSVMSGR